jgi:hypothetical protein
MADEPQLRMVLIRARSSLEVRQLRQMPLVDVVRVRPDPGQPADGAELLAGRFLGRVVTAGMLAAAGARL